MCPSEHATRLIIGLISFSGCLLSLGSILTILLITNWKKCNFFLVIAYNLDALLIIGLNIGYRWTPGIHEHCITIDIIECVLQMISRVLFFWFLYYQIINIYYTSHNLVASKCSNVNIVVYTLIVLTELSIIWVIVAEPKSSSPIECEGIDYTYCYNEWAQMPQIVYWSFDILWNSVFSLICIFVSCYIYFKFKKALCVAIFTISFTLCSTLSSLFILSLGYWAPTLKDTFLRDLWPLDFFINTIMMYCLANPKILTWDKISVSTSNDSTGTDYNGEFSGQNNITYDVIGAAAIDSTDISHYNYPHIMSKEHSV